MGGGVTGSVSAFVTCPSAASVAALPSVASLEHPRVEISDSGHGFIELLNNLGAEFSLNDKVKILSFSITLQTWISVALGLPLHNLSMGYRAAREVLPNRLANSVRAIARLANKAKHLPLAILEIPDNINLEYEEVLAAVGNAADGFAAVGTRIRLGDTLLREGDEKDEVASSDAPESSGVIRGNYGTFVPSGCSAIGPEDWANYAAWIQEMLYCVNAENAQLRWLFDSSRYLVPPRSACCGQC